MSIRAGSQKVRFPTRGWLETYLPAQYRTAIEGYVALLKEKALHMDDGKVHWHAGLSSRWASH